MRTTSPKLDISHLTANEEADLRCRTALELKDTGEYEAAREAMFPLWKGIRSRPDIKGLNAELVPHVLLCALTTFDRQSITIASQTSISSSLSISSFVLT
jgi:hypothetical protein